MKRFLILCAAALAVMVVSEQKASANFKIGFGYSFNFCAEWSGCCFSFSCCPSVSPCSGPSCGAAGYGYAGGGYGGGYCYAPQVQSYSTGNTAYAAAPQVAPHNVSTPKTAPVNASTAQQIGYYYYPSAGYYNAPSYWYGN